MILDSIAYYLEPIIRIIDDWNKKRNLALVFEARVGESRVLVSGAMHNLDRRPDARQLRYNLTRYMNGALFNPKPR